MHAVNFRRWHKWLFLVIGAQMLMWMIGGFYMVAVPLTIIHGDHLVKESDSSAFVPPNAADLNRILSKTDRVLRIKPAPQMGETVLEIQFPERKALYDLAQDEFIDPPNEKDIFRIAKEKHATAASPAKIDLLTEPLTELQGRPMPLWRAEFAGSFRPTLYFSPETGELISRRHDLWRIFDFVWMLHIMDYEERANVNNVLLRSVAGINLMAVITGLFLVYYTLGKDRRSKKQFKSGFVASVHKWLGLIIGAQVLVWVASGFGMSLIPHDAIDERHMVAERAPRYLSADDIGAVDTEIAARRDAGLWELRNVNGAPAFILGAGEAVEVIDARTGALISVEKATAERIAKVLYNGEGDLKTLDYLSKPGVENRTFYGPAWRADFSDKSGTTFYISALTGELQAARSNLWRVFDTLWMFHMMDYVRANSFNAPWIVLAGLLSVFIGLSGLILLMKSFTLADFLPFFLRPSHTVSISQSECGTATFRLAARRGETLFSVLHKNQVALDSSCGGGGTCGQCVVEIAGAGPQKDVSKADNRHLTREEICDGKRLACQKRVDHDLSVIVHGPGAFVEATVLSNREISSGMHEIVLRFPEPERHVAGQYRYFKAPPYKLDKSEYRAATGSDQARPFVSRRQEIRSYSMSTPSGDGESVASFIIRKMGDLCLLEAAGRRPPGFQTKGRLQGEGRS